jgi:hypothetical protein
MNSRDSIHLGFPRLCVVACFLCLSPGQAAESGTAPSEFLWQIGRPDRGNAEFALAPDQYAKFLEDGFYVVGRSDAKRDWPYVHPGPLDAWAGGRPHTFSVVFGLAAAPASGEGLLAIDLLDTHGQAPPQFQIEVNGRTWTKSLPAGAGDASVFGEPAKGRPVHLEVAVPHELLRAGQNSVALTTVAGCWLLYDAVGFKGPPGSRLTDTRATVVGPVRAVPALVEQGGVLRQTLRVPLRHFGEARETLVRVNGVAPVRVPLRAGAQTCEIAVPAVTRATAVTVEVEVAGERFQAQEVKLKPVRHWVVYLLPHSHVDIGYTHVQTDVERAQWQYLETAIDTARKTASYPPGCRFKWNTEVLWAVDSYLQQATPEKRQSLLDAVKAGQVAFDALYGNMLTGLCRPEELLRLLRCATELTKLTGVPIESAMITDVPGYTWGIVPAFAHSGVKYFSIGPNGGDRIGHTIAAWGDKPFWWLGPNGKDRVLAWMTGTGYYQVFQSPERLLTYLEQLEERGYPYDYVQVRHCLGDNGAPDVNFADHVKAWNETHAYPKLVIATTAEMFRDFERTYGDRLPVAAGDFTPYWEDGAGSSARETALNRAAAERLVQAETLFALFNRQAYPLRDFYQAWRNVVLYDEHTWGAHNSVSAPDAPFVKSQWTIKQANALDADRQSRALIAAANNARGEPVPQSSLTNVIDVISTTGSGMPWGLVAIAKDLSSAGDAVLASPDAAQALVSQRLTSGELVFRLCHSGLRAYRFYITSAGPQRTNVSAATAEGTVLRAPRSALAPALSVRLDERTGAIASLRYDEHEYVGTNAPAALNDYWYLPGSEFKGAQRNGRVRITVKETGPLVASLLVESDAPGCRKLTREVRLHALRNYVEIIDTLDKLPVRAKEGVHFGFAFDVPDGVTRLDMPWSVVRPETDQVPGACKNWFAVQRWVDISNDKYGVTWLTPDAPLVEAGGITANLVGSMSLADWITNLPPSQTIYSWAMNNHWHTNYRADQEGPTTFRYLIVPHQGGFSASRASRLGLEFGQPLLALPARGETLREPPLRFSPGDATLTAFKPSDDGQAWIARFFGAAEQTATVRLEWAQASPNARLWFSDNSERPLRPATTVPVEVPPRTIVTLRLEREP